MMYDSHVHTRFSTDSEMRGEDALAKARELGLGLVFTEHYDYGYAEDGTEFTFSAEDYWAAYGPLRGQGLRLGVEVGMRRESREANRSFVGRVPFDQVIGSIHMLGGQDIAFPPFYGGKGKQEAYGAYFAAMAEEALCQDIDVLGHIDYIARYAPYEDPEVHYGAFREGIDRVLETVVGRGILMELNTRRLGDPRALEALAPIYRRYREMGGRYVTIGSDAHGADRIGMHFRAARDFAASMGLGVAAFCERKMEVVEG